MVLSEGSLLGSASHATVLQPRSTTTNERSYEPYRLMTHNKAHPRQYAHTDKPPPPLSPSSKSEVSSCSSFHDTLDIDPQTTEDTDDDEEWDNDELMLEKKIFDSPRLIKEDDEIFCARETHSLYQESEQRWQMISEVAGSHRQDGSCLVIPRNINPTTLKCGIVSHLVGRRVSRLCLSLDDKDDILPQWLDAIIHLFPNLQELYLFQDSSFLVVEEGELAASKRMQRLYILYRMPHLLCIDGEAITAEERELARPSTPGGARVHPHDWMHKDDEYMMPNTGGNDQVYLGALDLLRIPANASIGSNTAMELGAELSQLTERVARLYSDDGQASLDEALEEASSLFGEDLIVQTVASVSSLCCEERQDLVGCGWRDVSDLEECTSAVPDSEKSPRATNLYLHPPPPPPVAPGKPRIPCPVPDVTREGRKSVTAPPSASSLRTVPLQCHEGLDDSYELVSVASSHHEWTAACGVLSFRTDRGCAPRFRLNFLGKHRKQGMDTKITENAHRSPSKAIGIANIKSLKEDSLAPMQRLRWQKDEVAMNTIANRRRSSIVTNSDASLSTVANQLVLPAKSLTSPFPMQFRDRKLRLHISTSDNVLSSGKSSEDTITLTAPRARGSVVMDTITKPMTMTVLGATQQGQRTKPSDERDGTTCIKSSKIGFPPPCPPGAVRRKVVAASLLQRDQLERKTARSKRQMDRRMRLFQQQNARSSSMMDRLDDDSTDSDEDNIVIEKKHDSRDAGTTSQIQRYEW